MGYYEFILIIVLVTGYIVAIKKKEPPCFQHVRLNLLTCEGVAALRWFSFFVPLS